MRNVVGLGNPGREYTHTRHNIGFLVIDEFAKRHKIRLTANKSFKALIGKGVLDDEQIMLIKPMTYMNNSGISVRNIINYTRESFDKLLVVCDDLHLPLGKIRVRGEGSGGGHKGLNSLMANLDTQAFSRIRIGLGQPVGSKTNTEFVLEKFTAEEKEVVELAITRATDVVACWIDHGINRCMNQFN